jgi:hypothetical protein
MLKGASTRLSKAKELLRTLQHHGFYCGKSRLKPPKTISAIPKGKNAGVRIMKVINSQSSVFPVEKENQMPDSQPPIRLKSGKIQILGLN